MFKVNQLISFSMKPFSDDSLDICELYIHNYVCFEKSEKTQTHCFINELGKILTSNMVVEFKI